MVAEHPDNPFLDASEREERLVDRAEMLWHGVPVVVSGRVEAQRLCWPYIEAQETNKTQ